MSASPDMTAKECLRWECAAVLRLDALDDEIKRLLTTPDGMGELMQDYGTHGRLLDSLATFGRKGGIDDALVLLNSLKYLARVLADFSVKPIDHYYSELVEEETA